MKIPKLHDFPDILKKEVLEKTGCSVPNWEISVRRENDVAWSIVLSFLISANYKNPDEFALRLNALTGNTKNVDLVRKAIRIFNPFRNRYSCFQNEDLQQVVKEFKDNLDWDNLRSVPDKLSAVSKRLECPLLLIWEDNDSSRYQIYSEIADEKLNLIALHSNDYANEDNVATIKVCNFLLDYELGIKLKFASLRYFLKEAKISKDISEKVELLVKEGEHFLISLLNSDCQDVISKLYDSPYLIAKLNEAGFETDPSSTDSGGFSALHHALAVGKREIMYKLYYFSANNCCQTGVSYRNPDYVIVSNLQQLGEILTSDRAKFNLFERYPKFDEIQKKYDDLLRFNKFLVVLNAKILKIKSKLNYNESIEEIIFEASKRRDVILCVLDTYIKFFTTIPPDSAVRSLFDDYVKYMGYYKLIDDATAIAFFSNIILLKERLVLANEDQFSQIEMSFYLTVGCGILEDVKCFSEIFSFNNFFIHFIRRLDNRKKITEFCKTLRGTSITEDNVVKYVPEREILSIFNSFPVYKNKIHLNRLKNYIDTAVKIEVIDEKSVLVIQRVLQVIGEYVHVSNSNDYSFRRFLLLVLPKEVCRVLLRVRNELSHLKSYVFKFKFESEKNVSLFRSIQKTIGTINQHFSLVYDFYACNESLQLGKMIEGEIEKIRKLKRSCDIPYYVCPDVEEIEDTLTIGTSCLMFFKKGNSYKEMFEIALYNVENDVKEIEWTEDLEYLKNHVLYILWPLKWLIELLSELSANSITKILDILESMNACEDNVDPINDLKLKTTKFIAVCGNLLPHLEREFTLKTKRETYLIHSDYSPGRTLKLIRPIEHFLKILKGVSFLSNNQKEEIRKEIPKEIKSDIKTVEKLKQSVHEGFTLNIDKKDPKLQISYISKKKLRKIFDLYNEKSLDVLSELEITDPITELEEIFSNNSVNKKKFESLCEIMKFSEKTKKLLENLVAGQRKKIPGNNLRNLLNRIKLLKKILIENNEDIQNLWLEVKSGASNIVDRIVWHYLRDSTLQASVEMLLLDCMSIFESLKGIENPWIKSSNLYCGINLRNIISHGNPFLDRLCDLLAPDDLASEMIEKMLRLIEDEDAILAILELYEQLNEDYLLFQNAINNKDKDEHSELKTRILKCDDWQNYSSLLPYKQIQPESKK